MKWRGHDIERDVFASAAWCIVHFTPRHPDETLSTRQTFAVISEGQGIHRGVEQNLQRESASTRGANAGTAEPDHRRGAQPWRAAQKGRREASLDSWQREYLVERTHCRKGDCRTRQIGSGGSSNWPPSFIGRYGFARVAFGASVQSESGQGS